MAAQQTQHARHLIRSFLHSNHSFGPSCFGPACLNKHPQRWPGMSVARFFFASLLAVLLLGWSTTQAAVIREAIADTVKADVASVGLLDKYHQLKDKLQHSVFGEPVVLDSNTTDGSSHGVVYAVLNEPFALVTHMLSDPEHWCQMAILHVNIKACTYHDKNSLKLYAGRKFYQTPSQAYPIEYHFNALAKNDHHLNVKMNAPKGPFGTSNYLLQLEAIPLDERRSFMRLEYRYQFGLMGKLAMQTYLATIARDKVGFTVTGINDNGDPIYVRGLQGVVERNVMRYLYAIQAVLEASRSKPEYQQTARLVRWFAHISKHPKQLLPFSREEYMEDKRKEIENQKVLQNNG